MKRNHIAILAMTTLLFACNNQKANIEGAFADKTNTTIYLESIMPGAMTIIDSTKTDDKGAFEFDIKLADKQTSIYNIRCGEEFIPVIVSLGEDIILTSMGRLAQNYRIEGSAESEAVQQVSALLAEGATALADLSKQYMEEKEEAKRQTLTENYIKKYYEIKREHIGFIVRNASSLAGLYALYQRLPGDDILFNGEGDIVYYRMVADSVSVNYPSSRYLTALQRDIKRMEEQRKLQTELSEQLANPVGFPPVSLPNIYGQKIDLADIVAKNKATLVYFWRADMPDSATSNAELKTIYEEYKKLGFEVYQISLDTSKPTWVNAVQNQKLPWYSLCDFRGASCPAYNAYNITSLPSNFMIDGEGNMVAKNLFGQELATQLYEMLQ
ncbi:MAG: TlpA family protein disulfide reductase [Rikenellaceae bacterium]|nr:TlpA family protein disulfide reductase [Rikenellaceae bacterium]